MMQIIIFSKKKRKVGDTIDLKHRENGSSCKGTVVGFVEDNPKYHNQPVCGHKEPVNTGRDYYLVETKGD